MLFIPHLLILLQATVQCIGARQLAHVLPHFVAHLRYLIEVIKAGLEISLLCLVSNCRACSSFWNRDSRAVLPVSTVVALFFSRVWAFDVQWVSFLMRNDLQYFPVRMLQSLWRSRNLIWTNQICFLLMEVFRIDWIHADGSLLLNIAYFHMPFSPVCVVFGQHHRAWWDITLDGPISQVKQVVWFLCCDVQQLGFPCHLFPESLHTELCLKWDIFSRLTWSN